MSYSLTPTPSSSQDVYAEANTIDATEGTIFAPVQTATASIGGSNTSVKDLVIASTDCGTTWNTKLSMNGPTSDHMGFLKTQPTTGKLALSLNGAPNNPLYFTNDLGTTWTQTPALVPGNFSIPADYDSTGLTLLRMGGAISKSGLVLFPWLASRTTDAGGAFQTLDMVNPASSYGSEAEGEGRPLRMVRLDSQTLLVAGTLSYTFNGFSADGPGHVPLIRMSQDNGKTWATVTAPGGLPSGPGTDVNVTDFVARSGGEIDISFLYYDPNTSNLESSVFESADRGKTWNSVTAPAVNAFEPYYALATNNQGNLFILAYGYQMGGGAVASLCSLDPGVRSCTAGTTVTVPVPTTVGGKTGDPSFYGVGAVDDAVFVSGQIDNQPQGVARTSMAFILRYF